MGGSSSRPSFKFADERRRYVQKSVKHATKGQDDEIDGVPASVRSDTSINPAAEDYPFENLVFEGGGIKTISYIGVIKALADANVLRHIERFGGSSTGAYLSLLLALECSIEEIEKILLRNPRSSLYDSWACCISCKLFTYYGWQPYESEYDFLGKVIEEKLGEKDATFLDLYVKKKKELCVVISNISHKEEEYMHVKTTPNLPLREAVRMSSAYPGFFRPVIYQQNGVECYMADGSLVSSYPVHCFDGWWLSMEPEDSFFNKLHEIFDTPSIVGKLERFNLRENERNRTLGFILYSDTDDDLYKSFFKQGREYELVKYPDTPLGRKARLNQRLRREEVTVKEAFRRLVQAMRKRHITENVSIPVPTLKEIMSDEKFTSRHRETLFGKESSVEDILRRFDTHNSGWTNEKFVKLIEGLCFDILRGKFLGQSVEIKDAFSYGSSVLEAATTTCERMYFKDDVLERTVGINTHHIGTFTKELKKEDRDFVIQVAYDDTMDFLRNYAKRSKNPTAAATFTTKPESY
uniref:Uncharacterized protein LOC111125742 n=1 Tax=Crassostrea virginica TaxID=6565 RepID=A0A8B8DF10_CRAVI|nr:uncharacterized protein LOC111125742 [Crassostrea virginica]